MPKVGDTYRVNYIAKNFQQGFTDVRMIVYRPDKTKLGVYALTEVNQGDGKGIYEVDFYDSTQPGIYLFVVNSASCPKKDAKQVFFDPVIPDRPVIVFG